jgi:hypothetical protein
VLTSVLAMTIWAALLARAAYLVVRPRSEPVLVPVTHR